jgi:uncharacterized protein with PIN domain
MPDRKGDGRTPRRRAVVAWVVDTCLLIDVAENDPEFGRDSARLLDRKRPAELVIAPVSYIELASLFQRRTRTAKRLSGIRWRELDARLDLARHDCGVSRVVRLHSQAPGKANRQTPNCRHSNRRLCHSVRRIINEEHKAFSQLLS